MTYPETQHFFWKLVKSLIKSVSLLITCNILNLGVGHIGNEEYRLSDAIIIISVIITLD